jgi:hypothetical protein
MPLNQGVVGVQNNADSSNPLTVRMGKQGEQLISELHGRYYEQAYRGNMFSVASQAVATTTVGLATTYTGLVISNPIGSGVNLAMNKCTVMQSVIQATQIEAFAIAVGFNTSTNVTHTTPATPQSCLIGAGTVALAKADISATLPTAPLYDTFVSQTSTATAQPTQSVIDFEGSKILKPGAYALWVTPAQASVAGMWFSFQWEEVPI